MGKEKSLVKIDTEWLEEWGYTVDEIRTGDVWIWAIDKKGRIVYFEKESAVFSDSDDYPTEDDRIFRVRIDRTFPFVFIELLEQLN